MHSDGKRLTPRSSVTHATHGPRVFQLLKWQGHNQDVWFLALAAGEFSCFLWQFLQIEALNVLRPY